MELANGAGAVADLHPSERLETDPMRAAFATQLVGLTVLLGSDVPAGLSGVALIAGLRRAGS